MKRALGTHQAYARERKRPLLEKTCLFEAAQGKNLNGNMFALMRELAWNPDFSEYEAVFVTQEDNFKAAQKMYARYGMHPVFVVRGSDEYDRYLARCKYVFTDNSFPTYFHKREDQVYLNTWHGTPLKKLGISNIQNSIASLSNVQKNFLTADYVLFPNQLTKDCFFKDYRLDVLFSNNILMADYPRNDALVDPAIREVVRKRHKLEGKRIAAYLPTWRGTARTADVKNQAIDLQIALTEIDKHLDDSTILFVNLHFLLSDSLNYSVFKHIKRFPKEFETYDFLAACDVLVTDYSSVMFDFACTQRKIVLYPYDKEDYLKSVGTYLDYDELPFPVATSPKELSALISEENIDSYDDFRQEYCSYHTGHASRDVLETIINDNASLVPLKNDHVRPVSIRYINGLTRGSERQAIERAIRDDWPEDGLLVMMGGVIPENVEMLMEAPDTLNYFSLTSYRQLNIFQKVLFECVRHNGLAARMLESPLNKIMESEYDRLFPGIDAREVVLLSNKGDYASFVLGVANCPKTAYVDDLRTALPDSKKKIEAAITVGDYTEQKMQQMDPCLLDEDSKLTFYDNLIRPIVLTKHCENDERAVRLKGKMLILAFEGASAGAFTFILPTQEPVGSITVDKASGNKLVCSYELEIPLSMASVLPTQNAIILKYESSDGRSGENKVEYGPLDLGQSPRKRLDPVIEEQTKTAMFFRHSAKNYLYLTVREANLSDDPEELKKIDRAFLLSKIDPKRKNAIVLYEKQAARYEESASVVYEKLIDLGYDNAWFILDDDYPYRGEIKEKYLSHIVSKGSFEHYLLFFSAKTFIGSEALAHSIELRTSSDRIADRLADQNLNYVFLQHGVMYMVSLDSASRTMFKPRKTKKGKFRVVTSSKAEKAHFTSRGGYESNLLYVCGLPKFDRNVWDDGADLITVMPTWRPWENNAARLAFIDTGYYRLIERIVSSVPEELLEKVVILPHPLFQAYASGSDFALKKYMDWDSRYDDILRKTKLLITDYSSIAYDAFYRGANVIFDWSDKEECMECYGEGTELMIDDNTAFGDVCYTTEELRARIVENYERDQLQIHKQKYECIVEFHDGKNTDRLVEMMRQDGIL